jgi:phosphoribosylamine--glycine ligase
MKAYEKDKEITGLDKVSESIIFHAGTKLINNNVVSNGGRVVALTSYGNSLNEALQKSYKSIKGINFDKMNFRKDIHKF